MCISASEFSMYKLQACINYTHFNQIVISEKASQSRKFDKLFNTF